MRSRSVAHVFAIGMSYFASMPGPAGAQEVAPPKPAQPAAPATEPGGSRPGESAPAAVAPSPQPPATPSEVQPAPKRGVGDEHAPPAPLPADRPAEAPKAGAGASKEEEPSKEPHIGIGYNAFDRTYFLFGPNLQYPNHSKALFQRTTAELEISFVPDCLIARSLFWAGLWAMGGGHFAQKKTGVRAGIGAEAGYRFVALDLGYVHDGSRSARNGVRFRLGPAFSMELFTSATYTQGCCKTKSDIACECDRAAWGLSIFPYWALEHYPDTDKTKEAESDGMFGISVKVATGQ